jgi:hypothetical protein
MAKLVFKEPLASKVKLVLTALPESKVRRALREPLVSEVILV